MPRPLAERHPCVSVIIPTRNRRALLKRTLGTVLGQEGVELEVVVVDDASDDGTAAFLQLGGRRLKVIRNARPRGVATARNLGLAAASFPWVAFVDDDDLWAPAKLRTQLDALGRRPGALWACCSAAVLDEDLRLLKIHQVGSSDALVESLLAYNVVPGGCSGVVARASTMRDLGGFDPSLSALADWDMWIRLALVSGPALVEAPLTGYVLHGDNMCSHISDLDRELHVIEEKHAATRARYGAAVDRLRWLDWTADMQRRSGRRRSAWRWIEVAWSGRQPRAVLRAVAAAVWPGWARLRERRAAGAPPQQLVDWLAPLQRLEGNPIRRSARGKRSRRL